MDAINDPALTPAQRLREAERYRDTHRPDLDAVCDVDLHIHSFYSDGYHSPAGRVAEALSVGMDNPDLTMHDWIVRRYGADQKPGNRYDCDDVVIIVKKIRRTKISEVIVEKKQEPSRRENH